ncbi:hypothetical protein EYW49_08790 [Siculibacillus lacustris]|uniref:histidine kinase n=1 Tax=Siculibacillus lacustris TaxID=1549641 RepID=A0A4Q9VUS2_9HYPH|nr:ATP-binding protein [Siculibacillus lacustris]TBW38778.1 hypothetical protein EYW49_08790 [Siculibacillus lacustris]
MTDNSHVRPILDAFPGNIAVLNPRGVVVEVNAAWRDFARRNGLRDEQAFGIGADYLDICRSAAAHDDDASRALEGLSAILSRSTPTFVMEYPCTTADRLCWFEMTVFPFDVVESGGALVIHQDITPRKNAEEALIRDEGLRMVGQFAGVLAHDCANLLTVISANLQLAEMCRELDEALVHVRRAEEAAERGSRFNRRLLALSHRRDRPPNPIDVALPVREAARLAERVLDAAIRLELTIDDDPWPVRVSSSEIESIVLNLVMNARDAMPAGGRLAIFVRNSTVGDVFDGDGGGGDQVVLEVVDTGTGMTADVLARAREPFYSTKGPDSGTGLGLTSVERTARAAGSASRARRARVRACRCTCRAIATAETRRRP